jgi:RAP domain
MLQDNKFEPQHLANIFYGHAQLGIKLPDQFSKDWYSAAFKMLQDNKFNQQALVNIFYGHALLEKDLSKNEKFLTDIFMKLKQFSLTNEEKHMVYLTNQFYGKNVPDLTDIVIRNKNNPVTSSKLQTSVGTVLKRIHNNLDIKEEEYINCIASKCDFHIPGYNLLIEVDGPSHFLADGTTYCPKTNLMSAILTKNDFNLIRISYYDWDKLNFNAQYRYLDERLKAYSER